MAADPIFVGNSKSAVTQLQNADGTALVTLLTAGAAGSRLKTLNVSSDDTSVRVIQLWMTVSGTDYLIGEVSIPAGSGSDGSSKPVKALNSSDLPFLQTDGYNTFLDIGVGAALKVKAKTAVTSAKKIQFFGEYGDI